MGRVFIYDDRCFRVIYQERSQFIKDLLKKGILYEIIQKGFFVNTWIPNDVIVEGFPTETLILEHERISYPTTINEWTCDMFSDAMIMLGNLQNYLLDNGYELRDPHFGNITFKGCRPIYMDLGSIDYENEVGLTGCFTYKDIWIKTLDYCANDRERFNHIISFLPALSFSDISEFKGKKYPNNLELRMRRYQELIYGSNVDLSIYKKYTQVAVRTIKNIFLINDKKRIFLKKKIYSHIKDTKINWNNNGQNMIWAGYHDDLLKHGDIVPDDRLNYYILLSKKICHNENQTCLELGGNDGILSSVILEQGIVQKACCTDYSDVALSIGYMRSKNSGVLSENLSYSRKSFFNAFDNTRISLADRYKSDIVFALALTQHLILSQKLTLDTVVEILSLLTKEYLIVEFMPLGLWYEGATNIAVPQWYTLDWFLNGFKEIFDIEEIKEIKKNRICILCHKRRN